MGARAESQRAAWVLNLDADLELAAIGGYTPKAVVREAMRAHVQRLSGLLLGPLDILVDEATPAGIAQGYVGRAFCPTPRALALLEKAGASPAPHPPASVLRAVNSRAFSAALGQALPGAIYTHDLGEAASVLASAPSVAEQWRVKPAFGMAGRGQWKIAPGGVTEADRRRLASAIAVGGVQIEPNVELVRELGIHGLIDEDESVALGRVVEQRCDAHGQWMSTSLALDVDVSVNEALLRSAREVAAALVEAGYFGPFGVDAFVYRTTAGTLALQPRSEVNARYSMGFPIGFGAHVSA